MRQARVLLPYAVVAVVVVLASGIALGRGLIDAGLTRERATRLASPSAAASRAQLPELSRNGRLAYWKTEVNGEIQLWAANVDGSQRRPISSIDDQKRISLTRWSANGAAVGYVIAGTQLVVARLDGTKTVIEAGDAQKGDPFRIIDVRWSPSGTKVSATIQRVGSLRTDVYVSALERPAWRAITSLENVIGGDWASDDELLYSTTAGTVGVARIDGVNRLRPLTGQRAIAPWLGDDGRVYFLVGDSVSVRDASQPVPTMQAAVVWSARFDGGDPKRESAQPQDDMRLDGRWPDGRWLVHRTSGSGQYLWAGTDINAIAPAVGGVDRVAVSSDKRTAIGFGMSRIVRIDASRTTGATPPADASGVLIESIADGDAWFPRTAPALVLPRPLAVPHPAARYAFTLGGDLWTMDGEGGVALLRGANEIGANIRRFGVPPVRWSPRGDKLLSVETRGGTGSGFSNRALIVDRSGAITRFDDPPTLFNAPSWAPDGMAFAAAALPPGADPSAGSGILEIRFIAVPGGAMVRSPLTGREVAWTRGGVLVLGNGTLRTDIRAYTGNSLSITNGDAVRAITDAAKLAGDPTFGIASSRTAFMTLSELAASPDGGYASVRLAPASGTNSTISELWWTVVRASDGVPVLRRSGNTVSDAAWSPVGGLVAFTSTDVSTLGRPQKTVIADAAAATTRDLTDGRFAGWSPDGAWSYVARPDGLWAYPMAAGSPVRISPIGVPVSTTLP